MMHEVTVPMGRTKKDQTKKEWEGSAACALVKSTPLLCHCLRRFHTCIPTPLANGHCTTAQPCLTCQVRHVCKHQPPVNRSLHVLGSRCAGQCASLNTCKCAQVRLRRLLSHHGCSSNAILHNWKFTVVAVKIVARHLECSK